MKYTNFNTNFTIQELNSSLHKSLGIFTLYKNIARRYVFVLFFDLLLVITMHVQSVQHEPLAVRLVKSYQDLAHLLKLYRGDPQ